MSQVDSRTPVGPVPIQRYGKYYLVSKLAEGGMAEIFLAKQVGVEGFEKNVVVKRMLSHLSAVPDFVAMFLDEARLASRLSHPNVVQILDLGFEAGCYFIAMEYLPGEDFSTVIRSAAKQRAYVPLNIALKVVADAAHGLHYAHTFTDSKGQPLNVVHRDVSPSNVFVTYSGQVKVLDFGIAKAESRVTNTTAGVVKGKYQYMAPEQAQSLPVDARADVYSLGVCLYEATCNARPFARDSDLAILNAVLKNEYRPPRQARPDLPVEVEQIIVKALARDAAERFESAGALAAALENYLRASTSVASGAAVTQYMTAFFGPERVAQKTRIDSLEDLQARGVALPEPEAPVLVTPSGASIRVPAPPTNVSQSIDVVVEDGTRSIGAPRSVVEQRPRSLGLVVGAVAVALVVGIGGTVLALKGVGGRDQPNQPTELPRPPPPPPPTLAPPVAIEDAGAAEPPAPVDAGAPSVDAGVPVEAPPVDKQKTPAPPRPVVLGTPVIAQVIKKHAGPVVKCFQEHRAELPAASGKVDVTITIEASGRVSSVDSALKGAAVGRCLEERLKVVKFPAHVDKSVTVTLPLAYKVQ
ncbi:MAG: protein kinase [Myxococcaceae bacterium]|jgi:serine/threonine-protein kinase|nr:protein kinase [Myxococcaceae bacterium]